MTNLSEPEVGQKKWFCATNTDNMRNIFVQGLITQPVGFTKYYTDVLEIHDGYIPLFKSAVPSDILEKSISEVDGLKHCIIEFSIDDIQGLVHAWGRPLSDGLLAEEQLFSFNLKQLIEQDVDTLFIPTPLPTSCIKNIIFPSKDDKNSFEKDAGIYSNVPLTDLNLKIDVKLFSKGATAEYLHQIMLPEKAVINYPEVYAFGGMLAALFYFAKNGVVSNNVYHSICDSTDMTDIEDIDISHLAHFFQKDTSLESERSKMYHGLLNVIVNGKDVKENIIDFLENLDNFDADKSKNRAQQLSKTLLKFEAITEKTASEQFHDAKTPLEKMLLMLFLRESVEDLMEYSIDEFEELDYLLFAMVFGIRDKFIKIPKLLREFKNLQRHITTKMAAYSHQSIGSNITFSDSSEVSEPLTLVDMFEKNDFKIWFANKQPKINDCLKSTLKIPNGTYVLNSTASGLEIIFDGEPRKPKTEVVDDVFYRAIWTKNCEPYNKYLAQYNKMK